MSEIYNTRRVEFVHTPIWNLHQENFLTFMKYILFAFISLILCASFAFGQTDKASVDAQRAEMKKLDPMIGRWQGAGWIQQGPERETFTGTENVQRKLDGLAVLVEGRFVDKKDVVIHETLAVLSYNQTSKDYDFNTFLASGRKGQYTMKATDAGWQWGFSFPAGVIRYDIKITPDTWHEAGQMSMDEGKTWKPFFEMTLKKVQ